MNNTFGGGARGVLPRNGVYSYRMVFSASRPNGRPHLLALRCCLLCTFCCRCEQTIGAVGGGGGGGGSNPCRRHRRMCFWGWEQSRPAARQHRRRRGRTVNQSFLPYQRLPRRSSLRFACTYFDIPSPSYRLQSTAAGLCADGVTAAHLFPMQDLLSIAGLTSNTVGHNNGMPFLDWTSG